MGREIQEIDFYDYIKFYPAFKKEILESLERRE